MRACERSRLGYRPNRSLANGFLRWHQCGITNSLENDHPNTLFSYRYRNLFNHCNYCNDCSSPIQSETHLALPEILRKVPNRETEEPPRRAADGSRTLRGAAARERSGPSDAAAFRAERLRSAPAEWAPSLMGT